MLTRIFVAITLLIYLALPFAPANAHILNKRQYGEPYLDPSADPNGPRKLICDSITPCGYGQYLQFPQRIVYFTKGICTCLPEYKCLKAYDDHISRAFAYLCALPSATNETDELDLSITTTAAAPITTTIIFSSIATTTATSDTT